MGKPKDSCVHFYHFYRNNPLPTTWHSASSTSILPRQRYGQLCSTRQA